MKHLILWPLALALTSCASQEPSDSSSGEQPQPNSGEQGDPRLVEARAKLDAGDLDGALLITDEILKEDREDLAALLLAAEGHFALHEAGRGQFFVEDAASYYDRALDVDDENPKALVGLARCKLQQGEFDDGADLAQEAAQILTKAEGDRRAIQEALIVRVDCQIQELADIRRPELTDEFDRVSDDAREKRNEALQTIRTIDSFGAYDQARIRAARIWQWVNRFNNAVDELKVGVQVIPESNELHQELQNLYRNLNRPTELSAVYNDLLKINENSRSTIYFAGIAEVGKGDDLRSKSEWERAGRSYRQAQAHFEAFLKRDRSNLNGRWWVASCELARARMKFEQGDFEGAERRYLAAHKIDPRVAQSDANGYPAIRDSFGGNYRSGYSMIGQALSEQTDPDAQRNALELFGRILAKHPDQWAEVYNNAGLAAREWGTALSNRADIIEDEGNAARAGELRKEARAAWETSYGHYEKAVTLWSDDARTANDAGLMLVYYLNRDYDRARALFDKALEVGQKALDALPADTSDEDRQLAEEAVGDAYQNIAKMLAENLGKPAEAEPFVRKAFEYYPNQGRDGAHGLMRLIARTNQSPVERAALEQLRSRMEQAIARSEEKANAGDYDSALLILDPLVKDMGELAPFRFKRGEYLLKLGKQTKNGNLLIDAKTDIERSISLDGEPMEPRLALAEVLVELGETQAAAAAARDAQDHSRSRGILDPAQLKRVHELRSVACARAYIERKQQQSDDTGLLNDARKSFREIEDQALADASLRSLWTTMELWAGARGTAFELVVRAWQLGHARIDEVVDSGRDNDRTDRVLELLDADDATTTWYRGRTRFDRARSLWIGGDFDSAIASCDAAVTEFESATAKQASFRDSCEQWIALCLGQKARIQVADERWEAAKESILAALAKRTDQARTDLGGGETIYRLVLVAGDHWVPKRGLPSIEQLEQQVDIFGRAANLLPDDLTLANNHGLAARDLGNRIEEQGQKERANELYEASYRAYSRANRLSPDDLRVRNDRALMLVFHLARELDMALELLTSTVEDGEKRLDQMPASTPQTERDLLREIVGDALENIGQYWRTHGADKDKAIEAYEKSLEFAVPQNPRSYVRPILRQLRGQEEE